MEYQQHGFLFCLRNDAKRCPVGSVSVDGKVFVIIEPESVGMAAFNLFLLVLLRRRRFVHVVGESSSPSGRCSDRHQQAGFVRCSEKRQVSRWRFVMCLSFRCWACWEK